MHSKILNLFSSEWPKGRTKKALLLKLKNLITEWEIPLNSTFNLAVISERWVLIISVASSYMTPLFLVYI